jgi:hypothetical protein
MVIFLPAENAASAAAANARPLAPTRSKRQESLCHETFVENVIFFGATRE